MPSANQSVEFRFGLKSAYVNTPIKDLNTLYFCTDTFEIYLGDDSYSKSVGTISQVPINGDAGVGTPGDDGRLYFCTADKQLYMCTTSYEAVPKFTWTPVSNISLATINSAGLLSPVDKSKLDNIADNATAVSFDPNLTNGTLVGHIVINGERIAMYCDSAASYILPAATSTTLGGVKVGSNITNSDGLISLTKANVVAALGYTPPTKDTTYTTATQSANGLLSAADKKKLDGIAEGADAVSVTQELTNGTEIGTLTINGTATKLYAPTLKNAFSNVMIDLDSSKIISAETTTDTLHIVGSNVTLTPDATNDKLTIGITKDNVIAALGYTPTGTDTTYSKATSSTLGLVKIGYTESGKNYPVELNADGQMFVNVPWTDTNTKVTIAAVAPTTATAYYPTLHTSTSGTVSLKSSDDFNVVTLEGTADALGYTNLRLGNNIGEKTAGNKYGQLTLYSQSTGYSIIKAADTTEAIAHTLPATAGILLNTGTTSFTQTLTSGTKIGSIKINGNSTDIYAPTNTDTHYTTHLKVGASATATANAAATNGNVYLNVMDNTTVRDSHNIVGTGATTVVSDANGKITINSTNTTYSNFVKSGTGAKAGLVPAPSTTAGTTKYLREDGTWQVPPNTNTDTDTTPTIQQNATTNSNTNFYPVFVDSNNTSNADEQLYTAPAFRIQRTYGTSDSIGKDQLILGSSTSKGMISFYNGTYSVGFSPATLTNHRTIALPDKEGTLALTSDIPTIPTSLKNPAALTIQGNGTTLTNGVYDGSAAKTVNITPASIGAASTTLSNGTGTAGLIKTTSTVKSNSGYTACPVINGVPYYKDTNSTGYLPISGGTLTGNLQVYTNGVKIGKNTTDNYGYIDLYYGDSICGNIFGNSTTGLTLQPGGDNAGKVGNTSKAFSVVYARTHLAQQGGQEYGRIHVQTQGTTSTPGIGSIYLGNSIAAGTAGNASGQIRMYGANKGYTTIKAGYNSTSNITLTLPNVGGILARKGSLSYGTVAKGKHIDINSSNVKYKVKVWASDSILATTWKETAILTHEFPTIGIANNINMYSSTQGVPLVTTYEGPDTITITISADATVSTYYYEVEQFD